MAKSLNLKVPPHNEEAEQSVLGSLLIDKNAILKVADLLVADDFYNPAHEKIYKTILELYEKHQPIDILSLTNRLKELELLKDIGGSGVYPYPAISYSPEFPFTVMPPYFEKMLVSVFKNISAYRARTLLHPWMCEEAICQGFFIWGTK